MPRSLNMKVHKQNRTPIFQKKMFRHLKAKMKSHKGLLRKNSRRLWCRCSKMLEKKDKGLISALIQRQKETFHGNMSPVIAWHQPKITSKTAVRSNLKKLGQKGKPSKNSISKKSVSQTDKTGANSSLEEKGIQGRVMRGRSLIFIVVDRKSRIKMIILNENVIIISSN